MAANDNPVCISISYHGNLHTFCFPLDATTDALSHEIAEKLHVPPSNQKIIISKIGLLKPPFNNPKILLSSIQTKKITLMGSTVDDVSSISIASEKAARRVYEQSQPFPKAKAYKTQDWKIVQEESQYTFITLRPLPYLPNPSRSLQFLQRLKDDAGIKAAMRKHKFSVPLLTEMDPIENTQISFDGMSRTLGLNRNQGEIIELRLRTDAYDGYRDYKTIRKTLCHELAHNIHGPHNRDFWNLCGQIEKEVERSDWRSGGRTTGSFESPRHCDEVDDYGSWTGGEYVLGINPSNMNVPLSSLGMSRRELIANATEERIKRHARQQDDAKSKTSKK